MKPKNCGECLMHKKCGYVVCGECRPHDPPCQRMKLLSACHKQRDRAREYKAHWLKAEQWINRMTQAADRAREERDGAPADRDWGRLVVADPACPEDEVFLIPPRKEGETLEDLAKRSCMIKLGEKKP